MQVSEKLTQERLFKYLVVNGNFEPYADLGSGKSPLAPLTFRQVSEDFGCLVDQEPKEIRGRQYSVQAGGLPVKVEGGFAVRCRIHKRLAQSVHLPKRWQWFAGLLHLFSEPRAHRACRSAGKGVGQHRICIAGLSQQRTPGFIGSGFRAG